MHKIATAGFLGLAFSVPGHAEPPPQILDPVVVTGTRVPEPLSRSLHVTEVITAQEIAQSGQQTLVEVLQARAGVEIAQTGGFGQPSSVFLRGANSGHTLVLIDGLRVSSATAGLTALENIPLNQIERIEIASGPLSSLYGADAIGGVVQVFTKSDRLVSGESASIGYGRYDTRTMNGGFSRRSFHDTDLALNVGYFETAGFDATKPSIPFGQHNPDRDGYLNLNVSGKLAHHFNPDQEAGVTLFLSEGRTHFDSGPITDDLNHQILSAYSVYSRNRINPVWQSLLRLGQGQDDSSLSGAFAGFFRTTQNQFSWQNDFQVPGGSAIAGLEYRDERVASSTAYDRTERNVRAAFAGYRGDFGRHGVQVNVREDDNSQFGNHATGSLGYGYQVTPDLKLRAGVGNAFKAPTFNDLYFPGFSNPDLRPERSKSYEAGVDYQVGAHRVRATYFDNRISDLIVFDLMTFLPQNLDRARIKGTELSYAGEFRGFQMRSHLTFQEPVNQVTGQRLPRRAREHGSVAASRVVRSWQLGAEWVASGARFDSLTEAPASRMGGYGLLNILVNYAVARDWSVNARWNNVLNHDYELARDYNTPRSNLFVSLQYQPK